jgi:thiol-disulfide isomerase/thioredoxin
MNLDVWTVILALGIVGAVLAGCGATATDGTAPTAAPTTAAPSVTEPAVTEEAPLTGTITRADLEAYAGWADRWVGEYVPDAATVAALGANLGDAQILLFLGTWCGDSQREVPHFFQVLDAAGIDAAQVTIIGLDRTKKDAEGLAEQWQVEYVPTFIVARQGREIGRIVERPTATLEGDLAAILAGA